MLDDDVIEADEDTSEMDDDEPPWGATMVVDGETWAVSLFWQPLSDPDNPMPEIKDTAEGVLEGADVFVLRGGGASQYGLGLSEEGHAAGQNAAAVAVAENFADKSSFVCVYKVPEGWWFLAVRNDLILSEEDVLYLNEEDAQRAFFSMMAVPDWGLKVAPEEWGIEGTEEGNIADALKNARAAKLVRLSSVRGTKFLVMVGGVGLVVAYILMQVASAFFGEEVVQKTTTSFKPKIFTAIAPVVEEDPPPWESLYDTSELLYSCVKGIRSFNIPSPGWQLGNVTCDGTGVTAQWTRTYGTRSWLSNAFKEANIKIMSLVVAPGGATAVSMAEVDEVHQVHSYPTLSADKIHYEMNEIFHRIGKEVHLSSSAVSNNVSSGLIRAVKEKKYPTVNFKFESDLDPEVWASVLTAFSGLEISAIVWERESNKWQYEGIIYVQRGR